MITLKRLVYNQTYSDIFYYEHAIYWAGYFISYTARCNIIERKQRKQMTTEKEKMLAGALYQASDKQLTAERLHARKLTRIYNQTEETEREIRAVLLRQLFGSTGKHAFIKPPFHCDYGYNIHVGENFYANFDCIILDVCLVTIGNNCAMAPGVHIYTATHPINAQERMAGANRKP